MTQRLVTAQDGREWLVRSYRFRRPPWRSFTPDLGMFGPDDAVFGPLALIGLVLTLVLGVFTLVLVPALVFLVEGAVRAVLSVTSGRCWIEAEHAGPPASRLTWTTTAERAEAVLDQVGRQLELGYERIQPHGAAFLGFD